jgi:hypothetical protein
MAESVKAMLVLIGRRLHECHIKVLREVSACSWCCGALVCFRFFRVMCVCNCVICSLQIFEVNYKNFGAS